MKKPETTAPKVEPSALDPRARETLALSDDEFRLIERRLSDEPSYDDAVKLLGEVRRLRTSANTSPLSDEKLRAFRRLASSEAQVMVGEIDRLRAENARQAAELAVVKESERESYSHYLTQKERGDALQAQVDKLRHDATCTRVDKLEATNARQAETIARLRKKIDEWREYADAKRSGKPVDDVPFG